MQNNSDLKVDEDDQLELEKMPLCAENLLIQLMVSTESPNSDQDGLIDDLNRLKSRLEVEGLFDINRYEINQVLRDVQQSLGRNDLSLSLRKLKELHAILRDLNIPKLFRLIKENDSNLSKLMNQNIYLFMGRTGSGETIS
jgi:hypothetical protein